MNEFWIDILPRGKNEIAREVHTTQQSMAIELEPDHGTR